MRSECLPWEPSSLAYDASENHFYTYDPEKAKSLIAQSGLTNLALDLTISAGSAQTDPWRSSSRRVSVISGSRSSSRIKFAAYLDQINNHKYRGAYVGGIACASMEPVTRMANSRHLGPSGNSNTAFTSPQYVELFNKASAEPDTTKRKKLYDQINDLLLDDSFVMPISNGPGRMLTRANVHDITPSQHGKFLFNSAWLDAWGCYSKLASRAINAFQCLSR